MNPNTQRFLQQLKLSVGFYQDQKEQIDQEKAYHELLLFTSKVFKDYQSEFSQSIEYVSETRKVQELKRQEIENISTKIRSTIKAYILIHPMDLEDYELECLNQSVMELGVNELKSHYRILNALFVPIKGALLNIGVTTAMLKELETKINDIDIALPYNMQDIESKLEKFDMASKAIHLLLRLDIEFTKSSPEKLEKNLVI
jgi:hypothetical protein